MRAQRTTLCAFTLMELMIVIAIIGLLVSLLLPALGRARHSAQAVACLSQMRSLAQFTGMYADDFNERMPRSQHSAFANRAAPWGYAFYSYITGETFSGSTSSPNWLAVFNGPYRCPLDRRENGWSYGYNVYFELTREETQGRTWVKRCLVPFPSSTVLFGELLPSGSTSHGADHMMAHFWTQYDAPPEVDVRRHRSSTGFAFLDGHAESVPFETVFDRSRSIDCFNPAMAQTTHR